MADERSCPWCQWTLDPDNSPLSPESCDRRRESHMNRCPRRPGQAHGRSHRDVHGQSDFGYNSNQ